MSSDSETVHEHHWEYSWAPLVLSVGVLFLVPLAFSAYFVYENMLLATIFAGIGTPLTLIGIAKWIHEGMTQKMAIENIADIGLPFFIISEILIFLSLFASYWTMRLSAGMSQAPWPPEGTPHIDKILPLIMTVILVASSFTYHKGEERLEQGDTGAFRGWLFISILLGTLFLGCTTYEYTHLWGAGFTPGTNSYSSAFYALTGFHASHVLIGIGMFLAILFTLFSGRVNKMFVKCAGIYWHFVDIVWFFVASQIYYW